MNGVAVWDPHHASRSVAAAVGHSVKSYDVRDKKDSWLRIKNSFGENM